MPAAPDAAKSLRVIGLATDTWQLLGASFGAAFSPSFEVHSVFTLAVLLGVYRDASFYADLAELQQDQTLLSEPLPLEHVRALPKYALPPRFLCRVTSLRHVAHKAHGVRVLLTL